MLDGHLQIETAPIRHRTHLHAHQKLWRNYSAPSHRSATRLKTTAGSVESFLADVETLATLFRDENLRDTTLPAAPRNRAPSSTTSSVAQRTSSKSDTWTSARKSPKLERNWIASRWLPGKPCWRKISSTRAFAGSSLEEVVHVPETAFHSRAGSEADETSEEETSVESEGERRNSAVWLRNLTVREE